MLLKQYKLLDLTHPLSPTMPTWNGSCGFSLDIKKDYDKLFRVQQIKMHAGIGTHMDAPSHRFEGGMSIADIPLEQLITPISLIDVSKRAGADYEVSVEDIEDYERNHGLIPKNALVVAYTGWSRFWTDTKAYRNVGEDGNMHFPAFSARAAEFLLKRDIAGIAIDTLSPDCRDRDFTVHKLILGTGKYIIENIANASHIPSQGSFAIALPLRAEEATEAPIRIVCFIPLGFTRPEQFLLGR
jgi:kynurenine formamidase